VDRPNYTKVVPTARDLMGKIVLADRVFERFIGPKKCHWRSMLGDSRPGWVVGERWLRGEGCIHHDSVYGNTWLALGKTTIHCLLVVYWPTMRAVRVPLDGYRLAPETMKPYPPVQFAWDERTRKIQRDIMANWPRDALGRWAKKGNRDAKAQRQGSSDVEM